MYILFYIESHLYHPVLDYSGLHSEPYPAKQFKSLDEARFFALTEQAKKYMVINTESESSAVGHFHSEVKE